MLALWKESYDKPRQLIKLIKNNNNNNRDITLPTNVKATFFPVVMYEHESCTIKKADH